jgi:hypothetical protein
MKFTLRELSSSEKAMKLNSEFSRAVIHDEKELARLQTAFRFYWGIDKGQWPDIAIDKMTREGRHIATYNLCGPTLDNIAGGIMKTPFSVDFSPVNSEANSLTYKTKSMFMADWELLDSNQAYYEHVIRGLVGKSIMEMYIDRDYSKSGNIGFRSCMPGTVVFDPTWKSSRQRDCKKCWAVRWMTPLEMMETFVKKRNEIAFATLGKLDDGIRATIETEIKRQNEMGDEYGDNAGIFPFDLSHPAWGQSYRVILQYEVRKVYTKTEYCLTNTNDKGRVDIPSDLKDLTEKVLWLNENVSDWSPESIFEEEDCEKIQYMTALCPSLSMQLILEEAPTEIQCGRLQFFPWAAHRLNGESKGVIESLIDAQLNVNYLSAMVIHKIQTEGGGGAQLIDADAFESPEEAARYISERNNPQAVFRMKPGMLQRYPNGPAVPVSKSSFNSDIANQLQHIIDVMWPRISKVSPASRGQVESSSESGVLFRQKKMQSDIEQYTIYESLKNWWNEIGEAYLMQAQTTYGDGVEREFYDPRNKKSFKINEYKISDGVLSIENDMRRLKEFRHKVIITESDDSPTRQMETMAVASDLMRALPPTQQLTITKLGSLIVGAMPNIPPDDKEELKGFNKIELELAEWNMRASIANLKLKAMQAENALSAAEPGVAGGQGGGVPGGQGQGQGPNPNLPPPDVQQVSPTKLQNEIAVT